MKRQGQDKGEKGHSAAKLAVTSTKYQFGKTRLIAQGYWKAWKVNINQYPTAIVSNAVYHIFMPVRDFGILFIEPSQCCGGTIPLRLAKIENPLSGISIRCCIGRFRD